MNKIYSQQLFGLVTLLFLPTVHYAGQPPISPLLSHSPDTTCKKSQEETAKNISTAASAKTAAQETASRTTSNPYPFLLFKLKQCIKDVKFETDPESSEDLVKSCLSILDFSANNLHQLAKTEAHEGLFLLNNYLNPDEPLTPGRTEKLKKERIFDPLGHLDPLLLLAKNKHAIIQCNESLAKDFDLVEKNIERIQATLKGTISIQNWIDAWLYD